MIDALFPGRIRKRSPGATERVSARFFSHRCSSGHDNAAAIAIPDAAECPILVLVRGSGCALDADAVRDLLSGSRCKTVLPDCYAFVGKQPRTATGKDSKKTLRERFENASA
jgi:fatty-acyl-CoA synthase